VRRGEGVKALQERGVDRMGCMISCEPGLLGREIMSSNVNIETTRHRTCFF
jgi:hypothetical protein